MRKNGLIFVFCLFSALIFSGRAKADIEALQAVITALGDVVQGAQEHILKAKSMYESGQQLASQAKKCVSEVRNTVEQGKKTYEDAKAKAKAIKDRVNNATEIFKSGDLGELKSKLASKEFSSLNGMFDGKHDEDETADQVLETMVRKKGDDSIANQNALTRAINEKLGDNMANLFGKSMVMRQNLVNEEDNPQNPESVDEAIGLSQKMQLQSMRRFNEILSMEASISRFYHSMAIGNIVGDYENADEEK